MQLKCMNLTDTGSMDELVECVERADIIKPTLSAALELLGISGMRVEDIDISFMQSVAVDLQHMFGNDLVAVTCGKQGAVLATDASMIHVPALDRIDQVTFVFAKSIAQCVLCVLCGIGRLDRRRRCFFWRNGCICVL